LPFESVWVVLVSIVPIRFNVKVIVTLGTGVPSNSLTCPEIISELWGALASTPLPAKKLTNDNEANVRPKMTRELVVGRRRNVFMGTPVKKDFEGDMDSTFSGEIWCALKIADFEGVVNLPQSALVGVSP
jgi:hypothetical protein